MSNPTRQEIIDAHEALIELCRLAEELAVTEVQDRQAWKCHASIRAALPPKPQPTMAEVEWDNDKHCLAEAEFKGHGPSIMLWETTSERISVINGGLVWAARPEELTPTGKRYTLTEVETHAS